MYHFIIKLDDELHITKKSYSVMDIAKDSHFLDETVLVDMDDNNTDEKFYNNGKAVGTLETTQFVDFLDTPIKEGDIIEENITPPEAHTKNYTRNLIVKYLDEFGFMGMVLEDDTNCSHAFYLKEQHKLKVIGNIYTSNNPKHIKFRKKLGF